MDVTTLHRCFLGTLEADANVRTQAEQGLTQAEATAGFMSACLDIVNSSDVELPVKKACLIYFKNFVIRRWAEDKVDNDEKPQVRDRIIVTIVGVKRSMKNLFLPVLNEILTCDYPDKWPNYLPQTLELLGNTTDLNILFTGALCFSELCRKFRWSKNNVRSQQLDPIIVQYFPALLNIGKELVSTAGTSDGNWEVGEIVKLVLKCYKFVTYIDLPVPLQEGALLKDWIEFHVQVINMDLPATVIQVDEDERSQNSWVKAQKCAYANLNNLYMRFGSKGWLATTSYDQFREVFSTQVVPALLKVYFEKIDQWFNGHRWISSASFCHIISFLEHGIIRKQTWAFIEPYLNVLISNLAFPLLSPNDETLELFENDPQEYIMTTFALEESKNSPVLAATNMISTLAEKRKDVALQPILQFAYQKLESLHGNDTLEAAKQKESALRLIGAISQELVEDNCPIKPQLEQFLATYIFPNFKSRMGFLRARTCDVSAKFDQVSFQDPQNLSTLFQGVIDCFNETDQLPVQFEAALAVQAFIDFPQFKEALGSIIVETTEKLLVLSNEIDSDVIPAVIQSCVENYSEKLEPFGINLMSKLTEQLMRLLVELNETQNANPDDFDSDELGTKTNTALGLYSTIITVLLYFENSADKVASLQEIYAPMLQYVLRQGLDSFFAETFEMIENTTFLTRTVSPTMWSIFEDSVTALLESDLSLNLEDAMPALKNYMVYGGAMLKENEQYRQAIMHILMKVFDTDDGDFTSDDIIQASELSTYFLLALDCQSAEEYIPYLIKESFKWVSSDDPEYTTPAFKTVMVDIVVASIVVHGNAAVDTLVAQNAFESFFQLWTQMCPKFKRVLDLKLSILGLMSLFGVASDSFQRAHLDRFLAQGGQNLALLLTEIPKAINDMEKKRKEFAEDEFQTPGFLLPAGAGAPEDGDDSAEAEFDEENFDLEAEDLDDLLDKDYMNQFGFITGGDLEEDPYASTPLDHINVFRSFKVFLQLMQESCPAIYSGLVSTLDQQQQSTLSNIIRIASE